MVDQVSSGVWRACMSNGGVHKGERGSYVSIIWYDVT